MWARNAGQYHGAQLSHVGGRMAHFVLYGETGCGRALACHCLIILRVVYQSKLWFWSVFCHIGINILGGGVFECFCHIGINILGGGASSLLF
jgi:hypothetical protein